MVNKSEIAERAAREIEDQPIIGTSRERWIDFAATKAIVERAIAESRGQPETLESLIAKITPENIHPGDGEPSSAPPGHKAICPECKSSGNTVNLEGTRLWACERCFIQWRESGAAQEVSPPSPVKYGWINEAALAIEEELLLAASNGKWPSSDDYAEIIRKHFRAGDTRELKAALRKHQHFVGLVLDSQVPEPGDLDGFSIEEFAIKCGFYVPTPVTEPCHEEACVCAELGFPTTCNRWSNSAQEAVKVCEAERLLGEPTKE